MVITSRLMSFGTRSGSTFGSRSASATSRTCLPNAGSRFSYETIRRWGAQIRPAFRPRADTAAAVEQRTDAVLAAAFIVDLHTVADVEPVLRAETPERVLHQAREGLWKRRIDSARVDLLRKSPHQIGTASLLITCRAIGVLGAALAQCAGPVQKVVHQAVDRHHVAAGQLPEWAFRSSAEQEIGKGHVEHLVGGAVNSVHRTDQGLAQAVGVIGGFRFWNAGQAPLDPGHEVALTDVTEEEEQAEGHLVEAAVAQRQTRQRAAGIM